jgi:hypothetical protein
VDQVPVGEVQVPTAALGHDQEHSGRARQALDLQQVVEVGVLQDRLEPRRRGTGRDRLDVDLDARIVAGWHRFHLAPASLAQRRLRDDADDGGLARALTRPYRRKGRRGI